MTMNRLKFNEGGQPVYLDDLEALQDNNMGMWKAILGMMTQDSEAFLLKGVKIEKKDENQVVVGNGTLIIDGMLCPFEGRTLTVASNESIYVLIKRNNTDERTFEDGQIRSCAETVTASLSTDNTGTEESYSLEGLKTFFDLFEETKETNRMRKNVSVEFFNGYHGVVKVEREDDDYKLIVDIETDETAWNEESLGYKGVLFRLDNAELAKPFIGKITTAFKSGGVLFRLLFQSDPAICPTVFLCPEDGWPSNFYQDDFVLPLVSVKGIFYASECIDKR